MFSANIFRKLADFDKGAQGFFVIKVLNWSTALNLTKPRETFFFLKGIAAFEKFKTFITPEKT